MSPLRLTRVRQSFSRPKVTDVARVVHEQITQSDVEIAKGSGIAIAVGSRGITNLDLIVKATVECVASAGARPFLIPAMGSHGGATAEGQRGVLASYGITEAAMGCPVRSSMEVVPLAGEGLPTQLHMDRDAWESDGVILINRIKPHTDFQGPYQSGLMKMAVIGLGKERQAFEMHRFGVHGLRDLTPQCARRVIATGKILLGIGIVENAYDETALIEAVRADDIPRRETELLAMAQEYMPRLPVDDLDVLIVDRLGKDISGTGMDTNIIGRIRIAGEPDPAAPRIRSIVVADLTDESHGNATGMGLADVITRRFFDQVDFAATKKNVVTSGFLERGKVPVVADTDREAVEIALRAAGCLQPEHARIIRISSTLQLDQLWASSAVVASLDHTSVETSGEPKELFDATDTLVSF